MKGKSLSIVLLSLAVLTSCSVPSSLEPLTIDLGYEPMSNANMFETLPSCTEFSAVDVDASRVSDSIGTRWIEGKEEITQSVTVTSDLAAWVRSGIVSTLDRAGAPIDVTGAPVLRISVDRILTHENVYRRAGYDSRIDITASLVSGGSTCWTDRVRGDNGNYGYAGNPLAYREMLNESLDLALIDLLNDPGFRDAICSCGAN